MDPASLIDTASQLRGLGAPASKVSKLRPWPACKHTQGRDKRQVPESTHRPRATRNPALGAEYATACVPHHIIYDARPPRDAFGEPTRLDARREFCNSRSDKRPDTACTSSLS